MKLALKCQVEYHVDFLSKAEADALYLHLMAKEQLITNFAVTAPDGRLHAQEYGKMMLVNQELVDNNTFDAQIWSHNEVWSDEMLALKNKVEAVTGQRFDVCVCIYYPDGNAGMDYHYDPPAFGDTTYIASVSLGEVREFRLREKETQDVFSVDLAHGSMILMGEQCQDLYEHGIPRNPNYKNARINLTFRKYGYSNS